MWTLKNSLILPEIKIILFLTSSAFGPEKNGGDKNQNQRVVK